MSNWYKDIDISIKKNTGDSKKVISFLKELYYIKEQNIKIDNKKNSFSIEGDDGDSLYALDDPHHLPDVESIFINISKKFPDCCYEAYVDKRNSYSTDTEEYFIIAENNTLKIGSLPIATEYSLFEFNNYNDFYNYWGDIISEDKFNELKKDNIDIVFILESTGEVMTEEEYYNSKDYYFCKNIDEL